MNITFPPFRAGLPLLSGLALLLLASCAEKEVILTGEREPIHVTDALADGSGSASTPIRLAGQTVNRDWAQPFGTAALRVAHPALRATPQLIWSVPIGEGNNRRARITADPVVAGGLIYTLDSGARVTGVTPSGTVAWSTDLIPASDDEGEATGGGMAYEGGVLYVSSGFGRLTALDAKTGAIRWQQRLEATGSGQPLVQNGLVYLVAGDDTGWAIDAKTGRVAWQVDASPSVSNVLGAPAPAIAGDLAIFAFGSGDIVATFRRGGLRRWSSSVSGRREGVARSGIGDVTGPPVVVGNTVYVGNHSGRTVALSTDLGERRWTAEEGALGPVWPAGGSVFLVSESGKLVRLNASDGRTIWATKLPGFLKDKPRKRGPSYAQYGPIIAGGRVIVPSSDGFIHFYNPESGALTARVPIAGGASSGPVVAGKTLYVVSTTGQLNAFR